MKGKRKKKKFSQRKVNRRKRISKARKGKSVFWSGKMTIFTFIIGFLLGLFSIFLFWPHLVTKPVLAFPSSDSHVVIVFSYQSIEIQSIAYKKTKHEPITSSTTNLHITIIPSRRLVVDEKNDIKEIYSNTGESNEDFKLFAPPRYSPAEIVKSLKTWTYNHVYDKYPEIQKYLWGGKMRREGYYISTISDRTTKEEIRQYVRQQKAHIKQLRLI